MILISNSFIFNCTNFFVTIRFFLTKLLTLVILFSAVVRAVLVAKLEKLHILFLPSFILLLREW